MGEQIEQPMVDMNVADGMMADPAKPDLGPDSVPANDEYQHLVDYCIGLYDKFDKSEYRKAKIAEITESRRIYEQKTEDTDFPFENASNLVLPLTAITVDNLEPRYVSGLAGTKPIVRLEMEGVAEQDEPTKLVETWFNQELENKVQIESKTIGLMHSLLLEGTVYRMPKYDREEVMKRDFVFDQAGNPAIDPETQKAVTRDYLDTSYEGGEIDLIPFTDVLCADDLGTVKEWEKADKIRIVRPTYGELMRGKNGVGWMPEKIGPWLLGHKKEGEIKAKDQTPGQSIAGVKYTGKEVITCAEFYITYQVNKDEEAEETEQSDFTEDRILVTIHLDSKTILRLAYLRDLNFCNESLIKRVRMYPEEGRSYGTSVYGKIKSIQDGGSDFFNAILNISYLVMMPWFFYEAGAGVPGEMTIKPGVGVPVDSIKGILFPNFNINPSAYLNFIEMFIGLWERLGSVANPQIGRPDDQKKTATEIMMVVQEGNIKFDYQAKTMKEEYISIPKTLYDLYYQHMPYDKKIFYNGKEVPIPRSIMKRNYKFQLNGSTATANKMIERKEAEDLLGMSMQNPLMNPITPLEDVLKSRGKVDLKKYINPEARMIIDALPENPEIPQVIMNYLKTKVETTAAITGKPPEQIAGGNGGAVQRPGV